MDDMSENVGSGNDSLLGGSDGASTGQFCLYNYEVSSWSMCEIDLGV